MGDLWAQCLKYKSCQCSDLRSKETNYLHSSSTTYSNDTREDNLHQHLIQKGESSRHTAVTDAQQFWNSVGFMFPVTWLGHLGIILQDFWLYYLGSLFCLLRILIFYERNNPCLQMNRPLKLLPVIICLRAPVLLFTWKCLCFSENWWYFAIRFSSSFGGYSESIGVHIIDNDTSTNLLDIGSCLEETTSQIIMGQWP